jgi:integrase
MPTEKLTLRTIERVRPVAGTPRKVIWDETVRGLGLVVDPPSERSPRGRRGYVVRYRLGSRPKQMKLGTLDSLTLKLARDRARKALQLANEGADPMIEMRGDPKTGTVTDQWAKYVENLQAGRSAPEKERIFKSDIEPVIGNLQVAEVTGDDIVKIRRRFDRRAAPVAGNRCLAHCSAFFRQLERKGLIPAGTNPCQFVTRHVETPQVEFLTLEQIGQVAVVLERDSATSHSAAALRLQLLCGMRISEALGLKPRHLDERGFLKVERAKTGSRLVDVSPVVLAFARSFAHGDQFLFHADAPSRKAAYTRTLKWAKRHLVQALDLNPDVSPTHMLRHAHAQILADQGASLLDIGAALGHEPGSRATAIYAHLCPNRARDRAYDVQSQILRYGDSIADPKRLS